jgi:hypothetical protein
MSSSNEKELSNNLQSTENCFICCQIPKLISISDNTRDWVIKSCCNKMLCMSCNIKTIHKCPFCRDLRSSERPREMLNEEARQWLNEGVREWLPWSDGLRQILITEILMMGQYIQPNSD